jgi:hypothetical protein
MSSKTDDLEFAISIILRNKPLTLAGMEERLYDAYPMLRGEDRRWIGVAMMHLERDGKIRYVDCVAGHSHGEACVVERIE